jgi:hypothetical protein
VVEEAAASDPVNRALELEEERIASVQRAERSSAGSPEVDLVELTFGEILKPLLIRLADEEPHDLPQVLRHGVELLDCGSQGPTLATLTIREF